MSIRESAKRSLSQGLLSGLVVAAALATGCSTASTPPPARTDAAPATAAAPPVTTPARMHLVEAEKLRGVMRTFDGSVRRNVADEVDEYARWEGVYPEMTDAAEALERSAIELSGHPPDGLELPARGRFQVLARSLATAAAELRDAAARNDADAVEIARTKLGGACRDCHERFRPNSPGVPDAFR
jgi:hypothetical protein